MFSQRIVLNPVGPWDFVSFLFLAIAGFLAVSLTYSGVGMAWDEALYLEPSTKAVEWVENLFTSPGSALDADAITHAWGDKANGNDPLHPEVGPVVKLVVGLGARWLPGSTVDPLTAMRLPIAVLFGLSLGLLYWIGARSMNRTAGFAAAVVYAFMPRVFGHAHIAGSETVLVFTALLFTLLAIASMRWIPLGVLAAVAFALAINSKITALVLPLPFVLWALIYFRRRCVALVFMLALLTPFVVFATWPWLWHDGLPRVLNYLSFYANHQKTAVFYLGQKWGYFSGPPAPWHYPFVIAAISLPEWVLVLVALGFVRALLKARTQPAPLLYLLMALTPLCVSALPGSPKYDGERLFFLAFPFIALLAGWGFSLLFAIPGASVERPTQPHRTWLAGATLLALACWGTFELFTAHPAELNYFNHIVGGPQGAYERGFETSYWGEGLNTRVFDELNQLTRPGDKVCPLALNSMVFDTAQKWGKLREDIAITDEKPPFDWYVLQVRQGMMGRRESRLHNGTRPAYSFAPDGVPLIEVFPGSALPESARSGAPSTETTATAVATTASVAMTTASVSATTAATVRTEVTPETGILSTDTTVTQPIATTASASLTTSATATNATVHAAQSATSGPAVAAPSPTARPRPAPLPTRSTITLTPVTRPTQAPSTITIELAVPNNRITTQAQPVRTRRR